MMSSQFFYIDTFKFALKLLLMREDKRLCVLLRVPECATSGAQSGRWENLMRYAELVCAECAPSHISLFS